MSPFRPDHSPLEPDAKVTRRNARFGKVKWSALHDKPLVGLPPDNPVQELIEEHLRRIGRGDEERPVYENFQTLLAMVEAGFGVTILPSSRRRADAVGYGCRS